MRARTQAAGEAKRALVADAVRREAQEGQVRARQRLRQGRGLAPPQQAA